MTSYPIQCKCNAYFACRAGWDVRIEFPSPEAAREAGWIVTGDWPRYHTTCPEHAEEYRARVRKMARSESLTDLLEIA
jgi:hypothetical protein